MLRAFLVILALCLHAAPVQADAKSVRDAVVQELREDGYTNIRISRTLLGRLRFVAERPGARREIVVSPSTGVILRDYLRRLNEEETGASGGAGSVHNGPGGGEDDDDDDDDEDDDDDDDRDDDDDDDDDDDSGSGGGDDSDDDDD